ncbi:uncharacterized protein BT62DRAFT_1007183 [Guyanagaster necrorhizus]|uniref:Uncharacterized protein n=1 Tax=Guyanagaster necrorhizus TaxID=856835 RepID=A0A9P8ART3_9AGAR|nr:uncharacterized protein BT62DRAFT_1007183 [Guyanagaster necrorhizus MCA 3950]KAG7445430.1 hypothetical protein BT62DRAFT_1007183 [Guyanagaster necrorhizus MCA 3950]
MTVLLDIHISLHVTGDTKGHYVKEKRWQCPEGPEPATSATLIGLRAETGVGGSVDLLFPSLDHLLVSSMDSEKSLRPKPARGLNFWTSFVSLCTALALFALELTSESTALPTIDLHSPEFVYWIYILMSAVLIFAIGNTLCGAAVSQSMMSETFSLETWLFSEIVVYSLDCLACISSKFYYWTDLSLEEVSLLQVLGDGFFVSTTSSLDLHADSCHDVDLNLPLCGISIAPSAAFLHLRSPNIPIREGIILMDWRRSLISRFSWYTF